MGLATAAKAGLLNKRDRELQTIEAEIQWRSEEIKAREEKLSEQEKRLDISIKEKRNDANALATSEGNEERQRKWFADHQEEDLQNREDALWELEDAIRDLEGGNRWETSGDSDLRQI